MQKSAIAESATNDSEASPVLSKARITDITAPAKPAMHATGAEHRASRNLPARLGNKAHAKHSRPKDMLSKRRIPSGGTNGRYDNMGSKTHANAMANTTRMGIAPRSRATDPLFSRTFSCVDFSSLSSVSPCILISIFLERPTRCASTSNRAVSHYSLHTAARIRHPSHGMLQDGPRRMAMSRPGTFSRHIAAQAPVRPRTKPVAAAPRHVGCISVTRRRQPRYSVHRMRCSQRRNLS